MQSPRRIRPLLIARAIMAIHARQRPDDEHSRQYQSIANRSQLGTLPLGLLTLTARWTLPTQFIPLQGRRGEDPTLSTMTRCSRQSLAHNRGWCARLSARVQNLRPQLDGRLQTCWRHSMKSSPSYSVSQVYGLSFVVRISQLQAALAPYAMVKLIGEFQWILLKHWISWFLDCNR